MQLAMDGRIILDLDHPIGTNHIFTQLEPSVPSRQQSPSQTHEQEKTNAISSQREDLFTIQFESLEPVVVPLAAQISTMEISLASNDEEGSTIDTQRSQGS